MIIASAQITIVDSREFEISPVAPANPVQDMLWLDTSVEPPIEKIYDNGQWVVINDVEEQIESSRTIQEIETQIQQTSENITLISDEIWTDGTHNTSKLSVAVDEITQTVEDTKNNLQTQISQSADKISWVVEGDNRAEMALTDEALTFIGNHLDLSLNDGFTITVGDISNNFQMTNNVFRQESSPVSNVKQNDLWVQPSTGYTYQASIGDRDIAVEHDTLKISNAVVSDYSVSVLGSTLNTGTAFNVSNSVLSELISPTWIYVKDSQIDNAQTTAETASEKAQAAQTEVNEVRQATNEIASDIESNIAPVIGNVKRWLDFSEEGLRQGKAGSEYSTLIDNEGYHIDKAGVVGHVGSFTAQGLVTQGMKLGDIVVKPTATGGWAWTEV